MSDSFRSNESIYERILKALRELGPMTMRELVEQLDVPLRSVRCAIGKMRSPSRRARYRLRIVAWRRDEELGRLYPRAVWGLGDGPDAVKPRPLNNTEYCRRYRAAAAGRATSVFDLARHVLDPRTLRRAAR